jgi:hypothetical protein
MNVVCRQIKAKINSLVKVISMKGARTIAKNKEKWELIKNYTARRTFITHELKYNDTSTDCVGRYYSPSYEEEILPQN